MTGCSQKPLSFVRTIKMTPPPIPLIPSGLSPTCFDVLGSTLLIQCLHGWGWSRHVEGKPEIFDDEIVAMGRIEVVPESYVEFTTPRCGITGSVPQAPAQFQFRRFVAFIMSDGVDYNFSDQIAPCWRVIFGNGNLDLDSAWFPILEGEDVLFGYGTVGKNAEWLRQSGHLFQTKIELAVAPN